MSEFLEALAEICESGASDYRTNPSSVPEIRPLPVAQERLLATFSPMEFVFGKQLAQDNQVTTQVIFRAIHCGSFLDIAPSGRYVEVHGIHVVRFHKNQVLDRWTSFDVPSLMQQLLY